MNPVQIPSNGQSVPRTASRPPASEPQPGSEGGDFAQLMALQAPAEAPPQGPRPDDARQARARQAARTPARGPQADTLRDMPDAGKAPRDAAEAMRPRVAEDAAPPDPALAQWLQSLHRPEAPAPATTDTRTAATTDAAGTVGDGVEALPSVRKPHGLPLAPPAAERADLAGSLDAAGARAGHGPQAPRGVEKGTRDALQPAEAPIERASSDVPAATAAVQTEAAPPASPGGFALPAGFEPVSAASPDITAPLSAESPLRSVPMPVPLESPEFAQAFGLEVSVLARDGIQHAELHLNPAEMGPVSVQIALDGEKARIDFGAQAAATRAVIEASLPELAAALRDAGLTLAGGGVSQHAGSRDDGRRDDRGDSARSGPRDRADVVAAAPGRPLLRSRAGPGGVDLYA